jgi:hypothetical protein
MRCLVIAFFALTSMIPTSASSEQGDRGFDKLHDALDFVDKNLGAHDWQTLTESLYPPVFPDEPNRTEWANLEHNLHGKLLTTVWDDSEFPPSEDTFVLDVPRKGLIEGSRIKFAKIAGRWHLNAVYFVR